MNAKTPRSRLDDLLVARGLYEDREAALRAIIANEVLVDDVPATSAGARVPVASDIRIRGAKSFVSRGGDKLQAALEGFSVDVEGARAIDIGSSTGGFSDCLLKAGVASLACVDVNYGELAWSVRNDERVSVFERTNIRHADPEALGAPFDLIVIDVSFIGLARLSPVLARLAKPGTALVALVKPQFESKHEETVSGVVVDESVRIRTLQEVCAALKESGFSVHDSMESPIMGPAGNVEYLVYALFDGIAASADRDADAPSASHPSARRGSEEPSHG